MVRLGFTVRFCSILAALALLATCQQSLAINIDFAAVSGGQVQFVGSGDTFSFLPSSGNQFTITGSDGAGDSVGLFGNMSGTFTIGAITTVGLLQTASVSGSGQLTISDGLGYDLTGTLVWDSISTFGSGGVINVNGSLNLSSLTYSGSSADLIALAAPQVGSEVISFQFVPGKTLVQLTTDGRVYSTSFSGSVNAESAPTLVPDAGWSLSLFGLSLTGLWFFRRKTA